MTLPAPTYDLVMLLDPQAEETHRAKIVADAREAIEAQGELLRHDEWGERRADLPDRSQDQRRVPPAAVPRARRSCSATLNRTLRIADEVIRFRIIKLAPGTPDAPDMRCATEPARRRPRRARGADRRARREPAAEAELAVARAAAVAASSRRAAAARRGSREPCGAARHGSLASLAQRLRRAANG